MSNTLLSVRSTADWLYNYALSSAYRSQYVYEPSFALSREPDIWEIVRNDMVIDGAIDRSSKSIVRPWRVEAFDGSQDKADKQIAGVVKDALGHIDLFNRRRRTLSEARILGRRYGCILWERRTVALGGLQEMDWFVPYHIQDVDRRRFHWVVDWDATRQTKTGMHLEMWNTNTSRWEKLPPELRGSLIEYVYGDTEDRVGYGRGLIESTYFYHYMKTVTFEKISQGIDRWANGIWIGEIDSLRGASTDKTNEDLRLGMMNLLNTMRTEHVAVLQNGDKITVLETSGGGHEAGMDFMRYLDEGIERRYNGSVRPSGHSVDKTGSRGAVGEEADTSEAFYQDDREELDGVLNRDLVSSFLRVNRPQLERAGLGKARRPKLTSEQVKRQDPEKAVFVMNEAIKHVELSRREYFEKIEMTDPKGTGEETIGPFPEAAPGQGGADFRDFGVGRGPGGSREDRPRKDE